MAGTYVHYARNFKIKKNTFVVRDAILLTLLRVLFPGLCDTIIVRITFRYNQIRAKLQTLFMEKNCY